MTAYLVVDITVHDPEMYQEYVSKAPPFIEKHDGIYRVRGGEVETQEGEWRPQRLVVHQAATTNMVLADGWPAS